MSDIINKNEQMEKYFFRVNAKDFKKIPSSPIAYWIENFKPFDHKKIGDSFISGGRNKTHDNEKYLRFNWEISKKNDKWVVYSNGGDFRKYAGNELQMINWSDEARSFYESHGGLSNSKFWNKEGLTWSLITSAINSFRIKPIYAQYSSGSPTIFNSEFVCDKKALAFLNSPISFYFLKAINPTLNTTVNDVFSLPYMENLIPQKVADNTVICVNISMIDWNMSELSKDFAVHPVFKYIKSNSDFKTAYSNLIKEYESMKLQMKTLEEENNQILLQVYGLENELVSFVPLREITLLCNSNYRYGDKEKEDLQALQLTETIKEFISYGVGCMFGRYSLDKPGLILANQGDGMNEYLKEIPKPSFPIDDDNIIPVLEDDFFTDDIASRFIEFVKVVFGEEHHAENIQFIEDALGMSIRKYFIKDFYADHLKRYKKRPIYWMVSSPKKSFNTLIYMHRYQDDIFARIQNNYLREYITKLEAAQHTATTIANDESNSSTERKKATKEIETITKKIDELIKFDRDKLTPFAQSRTPIDLDDGVKVNYSKFEEILYPIPGLKSDE